MPKDQEMEKSKDKKEYFLETDEQVSEILAVKLEKIKQLKKSGAQIYKSKFEKNISAADIKAKYENLAKDDKVEGDFKLAGRLMVFRKHGKATFSVLKDFSGQIQLYLNIKNVGEDKYNGFLQMDIGDYVGIRGSIFRTHTDELTVNVKDFDLLSKSIRILPEKWHGLKDKELRYRQRYLDFIVNPQIKDAFLIRIKVMDAFRKFLTEKGFFEVETPMLQLIPGGAAARPFITHHNALDIDLYLRIAPELYLKRLIIAGFEKVFEINRNFRNEGISYRHNPEFTMLEFYQAYCDYNDLMDLSEEMIKYVVKHSIDSYKTVYKENEIDFGGNWKRISMIDAVNEYLNTDLTTETAAEDLRKIAELKGISIRPDQRSGKIINELFEVFVQPRLIEPTFIKDYPVEISPLARRCPDNPKLTERFELFMGGEEVANAFSELIDPADQFERFKSQVKSSDEEERITGKIDKDFLKALEYGMPPTGGEGIGIDRFVMILTNSNSIRDVILFPLLKPENE
jgi:lysyl-tRNA synthetase, class II